MISSVVRCVVTTVWGPSGGKGSDCFGGRGGGEGAVRQEVVEVTGRWKGEGKRRRDGRGESGTGDWVVKTKRKTRSWGSVCRAVCGPQYSKD